ncbi:MAG: carboxypeptidase regulatory-like domain-containing protein [Gemmatimonadota bacterium]
MRRSLLSVVATVGLATAPLFAQTPASSLATIRGLVFDSLLNHTPLSGAMITLTGPANRTFRTDGRGRFVVDSLPPGSYVLAFNHPTLDSIGFTPPDRSVEVAPGAILRLFIATPSDRMVFSRLCPAIKEEQTGVVIGSLVNTANDRPLPGAEVRVDWTEDLISKESGVSRRARLVRATTDSNGRYQLCGVPNDISIVLRSIARGLSGPPIELRLEGHTLAIRPLSMDVGDSAQRAATGAIPTVGTSVVRGTVKQQDGSPLPDAQVILLGLPASTRSDPSGAFTLDSLPAGSHSLEIRAIGFGRSRRLVDLRPDRPVEVAMTLQKMAAVLPEINVVGKNMAAGMTEFDQRKTNGMGHYIDRAAIERRNPIRTEDLFRTVPGLSLVPSGSFDYTIVSTRGAGINGQCSPDFFLDGARITVDPSIGGGLPVNPQELYGIEVYNGSGTAPPQYSSGSSCGVVLMWTRRGESRRTRR